jgi:hypothetical protein
METADLRHDDPAVRGGQSGQAAVESALTLPLAVVGALCTLQLFMLQQGRIVAQVGAFRATRAGSVANGDCIRMTHAAIGAVLPAFSNFLSPAFPTADPSPGGRLAAAFAARHHNAYQPALDDGFSGPVVWVDRESPTAGQLVGRDDESFDDATAPPLVLVTRLTFWYPLKIPVANWVFSAIARAQWGLGDYRADNPFMPVQADAHWVAGGGGPPADVLVEMQARATMSPPQYVMPVRTSSAMRMMTPARQSDFFVPRCPAPLP